MVLWMNNEKARKFLLEKGFVFTRRPKRRHRENCTEPLFYNEFKKKGKVYIRFISGSGPEGQIIDRIRMEGYLSRSGFESMEAWDEASHNSPFVYLVDLLQSSAPTAKRDK